MEEEGIVSVKVIPLGSGMVFLKAGKDEDFNSMVKDSEAFFNQWFSSVRAWELRNIIGFRFIWCKMYGIPIHV